MKIIFSSEIGVIKLLKKSHVTKVLCILWSLNTVIILVTCALLNDSYASELFSVLNNHFI